MTLVIVLVWSWFVVSVMAMPRNAMMRRLRNDAPADKPSDPPLFNAKVKKGEKPETLKLEGNDGNWFILKQLLTFEEATQACESEGNAHLAVIPTTEMAKTLVESVQKVSSPTEVIEDPQNFKDPKKMELGVSRRYWIGLTDEVEEGKWMWTIVGKELDFDYWYPGQPDHNGEKAVTKSEHCGSLWNPGYFEKEHNTHMFNDAHCTNKYYAICDKNAKLESIFTK